MKKIVLAYLWLIVLFGSCIPAYSLDHEDGCHNLKTSIFSNARIEAGYAVGKWIGIKRDYAELGLFLPAAFSPEWLSFADARGYRFNHFRWGASAGVGIRTLGVNQRIYGGNVYYDYLEGHSRKGFHRLGLGLEWLGACWDLRLNGYFRLGDNVHHSKPRVFDNYIGNYIVICKEKEFAISDGFDAEVGIPLTCWCDILFYAALGPYYYRSSHSENFWGGHARLELNWKSFISLQVRTSYDHVNHSRTQGRLLVSIPFDIFCSCSSFDGFCQNLLTQPVERNGIIFTDECCRYITNY